VKLLFVHDRFGAFAGAESNIMATAIALKRRGHSLGLMHGASTGKGEQAWSDAFPCRFGLTTEGSEAQVGGALRDFAPDVAYVHKMADLGVIKGLLASGTPLVRMVHDHDLYCMRSYKYNCLTRRVCQRKASLFCVFGCGAFLARDRAGRVPVKWVGYWSKREEIDLNKRFDRLIVGSEYMRQELLRNGFDPDRLEIHAPVPPGETRALRSNLGDRNLLVFAGQVVRGKGVDVLLEALALVRMPFECFVFGDGNHRGYCEKLCRRLGLSDRVHFKGYVPQAELARSFAECSVVLVPSVWPEPFGAVGLEGMRHGVPVVGFDAGGIREWLIDGQNGWLVPWMDRRAFAGRIEQLLEDKSLARRLGENGLATVAGRYGFSSYVAELENVFARVSDNRPQALAT